MRERNFLLVRAGAAGACVLWLVVSLAACGGGAGSPSDASGAGGAAAGAAVANVGGRVISRALYEMFLRNGREALSLDESSPEGRRRSEELREGVVAELIERALVTAEAERRGLRVTPEMLAERERQEAAKLGGEAAFERHLAENRVSREEYRAVVRDMIYGELMTEEAARAVTVSDEEVRKFYDEQREADWLRQPERVTAAHLLVAARPRAVAEQLRREKNLAGDALDAAVREEMGRRRRRAEDLRRRAAAGADFAALAREHSDDPASRERGGSLGTFARDAHTRAFDEAVFRLRPGEVGPVVETEYGFHVVRLETRHAPRTFSPSEAAPEIRRRLSARKQAQLLKDWLAESRRRTQVRVADPYRFGALRDEYPAL